ncbi:MAG: dockerin type I domain-containing protein, partial [Planctomycetota bacterium]
MVEHKTHLAVGPLAALAGLTTGIARGQTDSGIAPQVLDASSVVSEILLDRSGQTTAVPPVPAPGDLDRDGLITLLDLRMWASRCLAGDRAADINRDGRADAADRDMLVTHLLGGEAAIQRLSKPELLRHRAALLHLAGVYDDLEHGGRWQLMMRGIQLLGDEWNAWYEGGPDVWNTYHVVFNPHCYGCDGDDPDNPRAPNGMDGWPAHLWMNPYAPHGGPGGQAGPAGHSGRGASGAHEWFWG